jgi:hypothetical protein
LIDGFADDIHHTAQSSTANRDGDRASLVDRLHATNHTVGGLHGNAPNATFPEVLLDFEDDFDRRGNIEAVADDFNRFVDWRQVSFFELDVDCGACDLDYVSYVLCHISLLVET